MHVKHKLKSKSYNLAGCIKAVQVIKLHVFKLPTCFLTETLPLSVFPL